MKLALVLSGGGAKGSFEFGALQTLKELHNPQYDIISGVSVGCLNGSMIAMNKFDQLTEMWNNISDSGIYTGSQKILPLIWRLLIQKKKSIYEITPLANKITQYCKMADIQIDFRFGTTSLTTGLYSSLTKDDFANDTEFQKGILASATMPIIWEPVQSINLKNGTVLTQMVDGGLRNISPLGDVLDSDPTHIIIINCSSETELADPTAGNSLATIAERSLTDITLNQIFCADINSFLKMDKLVQQANAKGIQLLKDDGTPYKSYKFMVINPANDLGDTLDFSQPVIQQRIAAGKTAALLALQSNSNFFNS